MKRKSLALLRMFVFVAFVPMVLSLGLTSCASPMEEDDEEEVTNDEGKTEDGAVDLGLSVKWAAYNIGASSPEELGHYYAWGEKEPKKEYSEATYLQTSFDIGQETWGDGWRMPKKSEFEELRRQCTWERDIVNGVSGMRATAKNGNSIFFPAGGVMMDTEVNYGYAGGYWSVTGLDYDAWMLTWQDESAKPELAAEIKAYGLLVRLVR